MADATVTFAPTPMQEALWWIHQRAKHKSVYHITWRLGCDASVDFAALRTAWQAVVDRHEALRTSIAEHHGELTMTARAHVAAEARLVEVPESAAVPAAKLRRAIAEEVHDQPISLEHAPLTRLVLVRVDGQDELLLTVHHIALDGWAVQLLVDDLSTAYALALRGNTPSFVADPVPFHVYARELHEARAAGRWQAALDHWRTELDGVPSTTVVADRPHYTGTGPAGTTVRYAFSAEAVDGIPVLAESAFATPFAVVLAALQIVLARGGAGRDVAVGVLTANRQSGRDQELVGYLANLCLARADVDPDSTIADVVAHARDTMWQILAHQAVPYPAVFAELSEATRTALSSTTPLLLNYLGPISANLSLGDIGMEMYRSPNSAARSDIAIAYWDTHDGILAEIEYDLDRYDRETVLALLHDLDDVLAAGGETPRRAVGSLSVRSRTTAHKGHSATAGRELSEPSGSSAVRLVSKVWSEVLGYPPGDLDEDFFAAGGHSLKVLQLAAAIEAETATEPDIVAWLAEPTPRRMAGQLATDRPAENGTAPSTLVTMREGTGKHLHLVHGAGGVAHDYRDLLSTLPADWRVTLSQERVAAESVTEMAARYRADLDAAGMRPDLLGGWSLGGQIAFEMAAGPPGPAPALILIDSPPPVGYDVDAEAVRRRMDGFVATVCMSAGVPISRSPLEVSPDDTELTMHVLAAWLAAAGHRVPAGTLLERWRTYRGHTLASARHVSEAKLAGPALVVAADLLDGQLGQWADRFETTPRLLRIDTDHFGVLRSPAVAEIAEATQALAEAVPQKA